MLLLVAMTALASTGMDAPQGEAVQAVLNCQSIVEERMRIVCYDQMVANLRKALGDKELQIIDRAQAQQTRRSLFGFPVPDLGIFHEERKSGSKTATDPRLDELSTSILAVRPAGYGIFSLQLNEGGKWETTESADLAQPKPGDSISIRRGPVGGYMANIGGRRAVRVRRVR